VKERRICARCHEPFWIKPDNKRVYCKRCENETEEERREYGYVKTPFKLVLKPEARTKKEVTFSFKLSDEEDTDGGDKN